MADEGCSGVESVMNANGRWPFRASGIPTTQHSAIVGCVEIACSIEPGHLLGDKLEKLEAKRLTGAKPVRCDIDDII